MLKKVFWLLLASYLLSGVYIVAPDQQAVVLRFGKVTAGRVPPGIHYHIPYPLERVYKLKVQETKRLSVGLEMPDKILGKTPAAKAQFLTGDQNVINVEAMLQYTIKDPAAYLFRSADVTQLIAMGAEASLAHTIGSQPVDVLLTTGKIEAQNAVRRETQYVLDRYGAGVLLTSVNIESVAPPEEVAAAFRDVSSARADKDRIINEAHSYTNDVIPRARGEAYKVVQEAQGYRERKINEAKGDAARFAKLMEEYHKAREVTSSRLYLEALEGILLKIKKTVVDANGAGDAIDLAIIRGQE